MTEKFILRSFSEAISPDQPDPRASILIFGSTAETCTYYSLVHSFDSRIYLCMTQETFQRRLTDDPLIKLILLFNTDLSDDVRRALSALYERPEPVHVATVRIVSLAGDDADAFEVAYGAFKTDDSDAAERVRRDTKQALERALEALRDGPRLVISTD